MKEGVEKIPAAGEGYKLYPPLGGLQIYPPPPNPSKMPYAESKGEGGGYKARGREGVGVCSFTLDPNHSH